MVWWCLIVTGQWRLRDLLGFLPWILDIKVRFEEFHRYHPLGYSLSVPLIELQKPVSVDGIFGIYHLWGCSLEELCDGIDATEDRMLIEMIFQMCNIDLVQHLRCLEEARLKTKHERVGWGHVILCAAWNSSKLPWTCGGSTLILLMLLSQVLYPGIGNFKWQGGI